MKRLSLLLSVFLFSGMVWGANVNPFGTHVINPITNPGDGATKQKIWFSPTLSTTSKWTITASMTKVLPYNNQWGSWMLHLLETPEGAAMTTKLEFYDATSGNGCKVNLNNSTYLFVGKSCDMEEGTPIIFVIVSDGTGELDITIHYGDEIENVTVSGIKTIYGMQNGNKSPINVTITNDENQPKITADHLSFGNVPIGYSHTLPLDVTGDYLTSGIDYTLNGYDADFFTVTPESPLPKEGGRLTVQFTPVEVDDFRAELVFRSDAVWSDVKTELTGSGVIFPIKENNAWFRIQFAGDEENGLVFQCNGEGEAVTRSEINDEDNQLWQFTGIYNDFEIINKASGLGLAVAESSIVTQELPDMYSLNCITQGENKVWMLYNQTTPAAADDNRRFLTSDGEESISQWHLNAGGYKALVFEEVKTTNIPTISIFGNGTVVSTKYYTLQGMEVRQPAATGIYIVKKVFASGKTQAVKETIVVR